MKGLFFGEGLLEEFLVSHGEEEAQRLEREKAAARLKLGVDSATFFFFWSDSLREISEATRRLRADHPCKQVRERNHKRINKHTHTHTQQLEEVFPIVTMVQLRACKGHRFARSPVALRWSNCLKLLTRNSTYCQG